MTKKLHKKAKAVCEKINFCDNALSIIEKQIQRIVGGDRRHTLCLSIKIAVSGVTKHIKFDYSTDCQALTLLKEKFEANKKLYQQMYWDFERRIYVTNKISWNKIF